MEEIGRIPRPGICGGHSRVPAVELAQCCGDPFRRLRLRPFRSIAGRCAALFYLVRQRVEDNRFTLFADRIDKKEPHGRERAILL